SRPLSAPEYIDAKERSRRCETKIHAFHPIYTSHGALSRVVFQNMKPLTAHQTESEPALRQCSAQGHGLHAISGPVTSNHATCPM
ncbi:hypothetical protein PENARI_c273G00210, partial [Penicillium arizonense]